jgi:phenylacetate-CoA ligase
LTEILGRVTDTFVNSRGQKIPGVGFTNRYIKDAREISSMQIVQHDINRFELLIVPTKEYASSTEEWLQQKLDEFMLEHTEMKVTFVEQIPREKSGKVRFCKNLIPPERVNRSI